MLINVGTRDENVTNSGSLHLIKNNYLRSTDSPDGLHNLYNFIII